MEHSSNNWYNIVESANIVTGRPELVLGLGIAVHALDRKAVAAIGRPVFGQPRAVTPPSAQHEFRPARTSCPRYWNE